MFLSWNAADAERSLTGSATRHHLAAQLMPLIAESVPLSCRLAEQLWRISSDRLATFWVLSLWALPVLRYKYNFVTASASVLIFIFFFTVDWIHLCLLSGQQHQQPRPKVRLLIFFCIFLCFNYIFSQQKYFSSTIYKKKWLTNTFHIWIKIINRIVFNTSMVMFYLKEDAHFQ